MKTHTRAVAPLALAILAGCTTVSPDALRADVDRLAQVRVGEVAPARPGQSRSEAVQALLSEGPLDAPTAVRVALLNSQSLQASLTTLEISEAERVQAGIPANPLLAVSRLREDQFVEIERLISFNVLNLLTLPWRTRFAGQQTELAKLQAAQALIQHAANTRKAWFNAVAAQQTANYLRDAKEAAEAGGELARRMAKVGNWSRLQQAREQATLADIAAQLARAQQSAVAEREKLTRLMGLWGAQAQYTLPERLPDLPGELPQRADIEAQALRERLDVRAAKDEARYVADSLGFTRVTGAINVLELGYQRNTTFDHASGHKETARGPEVEITLPLFDWGQGRAARAEATYRQALYKVGAVAVQARSEVRESWHGWRTSYDVARHYRDEIVPLRKFINDETVLRYNGMLSSVWELLAEARNHIAAVNNSIAAQRDFWIADTDLTTALTGTSPGTLATLGAAAQPAAAAQGH
ncbi:TolC family protein [Ramlibacter sp. RBP-2]|uniref:TolC family protein n=1 Tax=Ramlibacter lithotrophicus TaxID=2606681 RepID=A0A7X6DI27_9BURK|nr:TolC family protein [Ramlibacter lithotrophicus]NKE67547.1 TolC family protein [Ramlibacter lithotrophicus]